MHRVIYHFEANVITYAMRVLLAMRSETSGPWGQKKVEYIMN